MKVRYQDFTTVTRSRTRQVPFATAREILSAVTSLLKTTEAGRKKVRLLGISVSRLQEENNRGLPIFRQMVLPFEKML